MIAADAEVVSHPYMRTLATHWEDVRAEMRALGTRVLPEHRGLGSSAAFIERLERGEPGWTSSWQAGFDGPNDRWLTFALRHGGRSLHGIEGRAPLTAALLAGIPGCRVAAFSLMKPLSVIGPHRHPDLQASSVRVIHLGLEVEPGASFLIVEGVAHAESAGNILCFDGAAEHIAVNASSRDRTILYTEFDLSAW